MLKKNDLKTRRAYALKIIKILRKKTKNFPEPMSERIKDEYNNDPYLILISCLLSLRARDAVTYPISKKLFEVARTPQEMLAIPLRELERIIKPIGFYHNKAKTLKSVSKELIDRFHEKVPNTEDELLSIKGIGHKTAALVLSVAFGKPAICVDTHVHRLANQFGLVHTKTADQTEVALMELLPKKYWSEVNHLFVKWGQNAPRKNQVSEILAKKRAPFRKKQCPFYGRL